MSRRHILANQVRYRADFPNGSAGTITLADGVRIDPVNHFNSVWYRFAIRHDQLGGKIPHFLLAKSDCAAEPVSGERFGVFATSSDTDTWTDLATRTVGASDIELYHSIPFGNGMYYIAQIPMYPFSRVERKLREWDAADARIVSTPSGTNFVLAYSTARDAGDGSARRVPALPFYGFRLTNASGYTKNNSILTTLNHPDESLGAFMFEGFIDWLLGGTPEAEFLLDYTDFFCYPCLNPQGVWAGYYRSCPQDTTLDHNRQWATTGTLECIDAIKTAMNTDSGGAIEIGLDFHMDNGNATYSGWTYDDTEALHVIFETKLAALASGYVQNSITDVGTLMKLWKDSYAAKLYVILEQMNAASLGMTEWRAFGANTGKVLTAMLAEGRFTNGPGVGSRDFNGTTDRIDWASAGNLTGHALTISLWVYADTYVANGYLVCIHDSGDTSFGIIVATSSSDPSYGFINIFINGSTDLQKSSSAGSVNGLATGVWTNLIITWDGVISTSSSVHIYKNGTEPSYSVSTNGANETSHTGSWSLGGRIYDDNRMFDGHLAQVGVWDRVLTAGEIANLAAGYAPDLVDGGSNLKFYFKGNTSSLVNIVSGVTGTADGTTQVTGVGNGPSIIYG